MSAIEIIKAEHKTYSNIGRYFHLEARVDKYHASISVAADHLNVCVHNASNRAWKGTGRRFESPETALAAYKTGEIRAMISHAVEEWKKAGPQVYEIRNERTGETLAKDLPIEAVDAWWKKNENEWFGVRTEGNVIQVVSTPII